MQKAYNALRILAVLMFCATNSCLSTHDLDTVWLADMARMYDIMPAYQITPEQTAQEVLALYHNAQNQEYIGEEVSQLEHALQAAQQALYAFDETVGIDEDTVIAALLHDIGHRYAGKHASDMDGFGVVQHELIGAALLAARGFSAKVVRLVAGHVDAKRYKACKNSAYQDTLTYASQQTLLRQGGAMSAEEAAVFEQDPYFKQILFIRACDEKAKVAGAPTVPLAFYKNMIVRHIAQR